MKVRDIMTSKVESIEPTAVLRKAARKMSELNIGSMAVVDDDGNLLGIITDRDISVYAIAMGRNPQDTEVQKVMTRDVATCLADQDISDAASIMQQRHIRRLAVMENNSLSGFLSVDDLARASSDLAGAVLEAATPIH